MKFSIITICKDSEYNIKRTIESVLMQNLTEYEYIIIDGASKDKTLDIIFSYDKKKIQVYSEPDEGISDAFNKGIIKASGEFIIFLNSGDFFIKSNVLELVKNDIENNYADIYTYAITSLMFYSRPENIKNGFELWNESRIPHQATFVRKSVFEKIGLFNKYFKVRMDYDFFNRCKKSNFRFFCNPIIITYYDLNGISSTNHYLYEKEGLAVRLLYQDNIGISEKEGLERLIKIKKIQTNEEKQMYELIDKNTKIIQMMSKWINILQEGKTITQYFKIRNFTSVAIYGYGYLGKNLEKELKRYNIDVAYIIDQNKMDGVLSWEDNWGDADCIVVTPFYLYKEIYKKICQKGSYYIISFEELLFSIDEDKNGTL